MSAIIKVSLLLTLAELFFNLSGYITHAILGRTLGPAEYGRYGLVITVATMIVTLIGRGVPVAMSKYLSEVYSRKPKELKHIKKVSAEVQFVLVFFLTLFYYLAAPFLADILNDFSLTPLFRLSTLIIPAFAAASFYVYFFTGVHKFKLQAYLKFFRGLSKIVLIVGLAYFFRTKGAILGHALAPFSVFVLALLIDQGFILKSKRKGSDDRIKTNSDSKRENLEASGEKFAYKKLSRRALLNFAWPITLFMIFYEIMITIDLYMVKGLLESDRLTGFYNASLTVGRLPFYAFYFLTIILLPKVSEIKARRDNRQMQKTLQSAMRFLFILIIPSVSLLAIFSRPTLELFYGQKYLMATPLLQVLAIGLGFLTVFYILAFVLNGAGKNKLPMWIALVGMIVNSGLNYVLINKLGVLGAALATSLTSLLIMVLAVVLTEKYVASFLNVISLLKYALATVVISLIAYHLPQGKIIFIFEFAVLLAIYFAILRILGEVTDEDLNYLRPFWKKFLKNN